MGEKGTSDLIMEKTREKGRQLGDVVIVGGWMEKGKEQTSDSGGGNRHRD